MNKIKILYLIPHLQNQGPVVQLYSLLKNIDQEQFSLYVLTVFPERENSMLEKFRELGAKVICGNLKKWQIISQKRLISYSIKRVAPDIVHSCSTITDGLCASISFNLPFIITLHNNIYEDVVVHYGGLIGGYLCRQEKKAIRKADCVIPCSNTLKKQYERIIPREYIAIPNGIDIEKWTNDTGLDKQGLREKLKLPKDKKVIISTGALIERKNPLMVIEAFKEAQIPDAILLMLGDGPLMDMCKQTANEKVIFTGRVNNVKEYLYASDLLISASKAEGLPYAILEAACTGIKMALSDIPQHREALKTNENKAAFFLPESKEQLKEIMVSLCTKKVERELYDISQLSAITMAERYKKHYFAYLNSSKLNML